MVQDLTALELYTFYGEDKVILKDIASTLAECPHLKKLGLGRATKTCMEGDNEAEVLILDELNLFESLCLLYGSQTMSEPLNIETLRRGYSMFLAKPTSSASANYLTKLLHLRTLKSLHIYNGYASQNYNDAHKSVYLKEVVEPCWAFLDKCSLRQLGISTIDDRVTHYINNAGNSIEELSISEPYRMDNPALRLFSIIHLPNLTSLWTREDFRVRWPNEDGLLDCEHPYEMLPQVTRAIASEGELEYVPHLGETLLGKADQKFILNRLHDHGSKLISLSIDFDFSSEYVQCPFKILGTNLWH